MGQSDNVTFQQLLFTVFIEDGEDESVELVVQMYDTLKNQEHFFTLLSSQLIQKINAGQ